MNNSVDDMQGRGALTAPRLLVPKDGKREHKNAGNRKPGGLAGAI